MKEIKVIKAWAVVTGHTKRDLGKASNYYSFHKTRNEALQARGGFLNRDIIRIIVSPREVN